MWEYEYGPEANETTIYWSGVGGEDDYQVTIDAQITRWVNGYPNAPQVRDAVQSMLQDAGTPDRTLMQFDFNYGFSERNQ